MPAQADLPQEPFQFEKFNYLKRLFAKLVHFNFQSDKFYVLFKFKIFLYRNLYTHRKFWNLCFRKKFNFTKLKMFSKPIKNLFWKNSKQFLSYKFVLAKNPTNTYKLSVSNSNFNSTTSKRFLSDHKNVASQPTSSSSNSSNKNKQESPIRKLIR